MRARPLLFAALLLAGAASAEVLDQVWVGDVPGTKGSWQQGIVTVRAPAEEVQRWLGDTRSWPARFSDVEWVHDGGTLPDGRHLIRFRSRLIGRPITLRMREQPGLFEYDGEGKDVTTRGKSYVERVGDGRTRVVMQTTSEVHGALGAFTSAKMKRDRARRKLSSDLAAIVGMANRLAPSEARLRR